MDQKEECRRQFKLFVDSLLTDLDAMQDRKRERCASDISLINRSKTKLCHREGFPVNIVNVTKLGRSALHIRWNVLDSKNITGYEIYLDGHLSNRYHNAQHEVAVICDVNVKKPHKITLVALSRHSDTNWDVVRKNMEKLTACCCQTNCEPKKAHSESDLWVPSIYIYQPS